ncbi:MAG: hypothetical protein ABI758_05060 [Candidatus Woesebacteria bacterium]
MPDGRLFSERYENNPDHPLNTEQFNMSLRRGEVSVSFSEAIDRYKALARTGIPFNEKQRSELSDLAQEVQASISALEKDTAISSEEKDIQKMGLLRAQLEIRNILVPSENKKESGPVKSESSVQQWENNPESLPETIRELRTFIIETRAAIKDNPASLIQEAPQREAKLADLKRLATQRVEGHESINVDQLLKEQEYLRTFLRDADKIPNEIFGEWEKQAKNVYPALAEIQKFLSIDVNTLDLANTNINLAEATRIAAEFDAEKSRYGIYSGESSYAKYIKDSVDSFRKKRQELELRKKKLALESATWYKNAQTLEGADALPSTSSETQLQTEIRNLDLVLADLNTFVKALTPEEQDAFKRTKEIGEKLKNRKVQYEEFINKRGSDSEAQRRDEQDQVRSLNKILSLFDPPIEPFDFSKDFVAEKERLENSIRNWIYAALIGRMKDTSEGVSPTKASAFWTDISTPSGGDAKISANLEDFVNSLPATLVVKGERKNFLNALQGEIVPLVKNATSMHDRATYFYSYAKPDEWLAQLEKANSSVPFGKTELKRLIKEGTIEKNSAFAAFRLAKQLFIQLAEDPNLSKKFNMYPFGQVQETSEVSLGAFVTQDRNQDWIMKQLTGKGFSKEAAELGYRLAVTDNRNTGLEEFLDYTSTVDSKGKIITKTKAIRSMSRFYRWRSWAKYSVEAKGSGRAPISSTMADKRPALTVPAEKLWLVLVKDTSGKETPMSLYDVYKNGLWEQVSAEDKAFLADNPVKMQTEHARFMGMEYFNIAADMTEKANHLLPDLEHLAKYEPTAEGSFRRDVARLFLLFQKDRTLSDENRTKLLSVLEPGGRFITVQVDDLVDFNFRNALKNAGDYAWDNTPVTKEIFEELFSLPSDTDPKGYVPHRKIMEAVSEGSKGKPEFAMWSVITILLMSELERYSIPEHDQGHKDLLTPVPTKSGRPALHWGQREALITWLLEIQSGLPEEYKAHYMSEDNIRTMFKKLGIDETDASKSVDIQWLLNSEARSSMQVIPSLFPWLDKFVDWIPLGTDVK